MYNSICDIRIDTKDKSPFISTDHHSLQVGDEDIGKFGGDHVFR